MPNNWTAHRVVVSVLWPASLLVSGAVAVLAMGLAEDTVQALPAAGVLALTSVLGIFSFSRHRAARRLHSAVEAYAERELAQMRSRQVSRAI
jgi:hypothetical protein